MFILGWNDPFHSLIQLNTMRTWMVLLGFTALIIACNTTKEASYNPKKGINLTINLQDTVVALDSLALYAWTGLQAQLVSKEALMRKEGGYTTTFQFKKLPKGMYYVGTGLQDLRPMLLGYENKVVLTGSSDKVSQLVFDESDLNKAYSNLLLRLRKDNERFSNLMTEYEKTKGQPKNQEIIQQLKQEDDQKLAYLNSLKKANSPLAPIMAFNTFQSYPNHAAEGQTPGEYFAKSFFENVNLKDTTYLRLPFFYESIKNYTSALTSVQLTVPVQQQHIDALLAKIGEDNPLHHSAMVATMFGVMNRNNRIFINLGKRYLNKHKGKNAILDGFISKQVIALKGPLGVGDEAANLSAATPKGKTYSLEKMRGKYVLIDFWASWCGPCRRENPNVVRLYKKYNKKGFEILGVSLDNNKEKWINAIAKDNLTWKHISDLKGWASTLAKPYGVRGIPYTVLVDPQGKIIATRLRGASLEAKLREIFGS